MYVGISFHCVCLKVHCTCVMEIDCFQYHTGEVAKMSSKGQDQHLRELLLEKTGEIQKLKGEIEK